MLRHDCAKMPAKEDSMRNLFLVSLICLAQFGSAQAPAPSYAIPNPTYVSIPMEIKVNRPAAEVWKRVGNFCDIGEWLRIPCTITAGKDGEFGAVRSVASEVLVGKTERTAPNSPSLPAVI